MNITLEQEEKLSLALNEIDESKSKLNDWEKGFYEDMAARYQEWGARISLSPKQWAVIERMLDKVRK
jgi:hypothetical protein